MGALAPRAKHIWAQKEPWHCGCPSTAASSDLHQGCRAFALLCTYSYVSSTSSCVCPLFHNTDAPACLVVREQNCQKHINLFSGLNLLQFWMKMGFLARASTSGRITLSGQLAALLHFTAKLQRYLLCDFSLLCIKTDLYNVFLLLL